MQSLRNQAPHSDWVWPYCAGMVASHGRQSVPAATRVLDFWRVYRRAHPGDAAAERQRLFCLSFLKLAGAPYPLGRRSRLPAARSLS